MKIVQQLNHVLAELFLHLCQEAVLEHLLLVLQHQLQVVVDRQEAIYFLSIHVVGEVHLSKIIRLDTMALVVTMK